MLTARTRPEDVLQGFEAGADDYLPKPFDLAILLARIESLLRRNNWLRSSLPAKGESVAPEAESLDVFHFDDRTVDFANLQLRGGGPPFQLTLMQAHLLRCLRRNSGRPLSLKAILHNHSD